MTSFILVIDDRGRIVDVAEAALREAGAQVITAFDLLSAKRKMIQSVPDLVLTSLELGIDPYAGVHFCLELKQHPALSQVPVILITETVNDQVLQMASESGAKGLIPWPVTAPVLLQRVRPLLPGLGDGRGNIEPLPAEPEKNQTVASEAQKGAVAIGGGSPKEEKLKLAQQLLAKALHNLKTSDLLEIIELEDVPRVVSEITRSVCGLSEKEEGRDDSARPVDKVQRGTQDKETKIELESIFRK